MILPKKRERQRSGIARAPQREWPRHRKHIRTLECSVPGCELQRFAVIECAHVRHETDGGTAIKPADWWTLPLCAVHHRQQHEIGEPAFERKYAIDLKALALALSRRSPDKAMIEAMKQAGVT